MTVTSVCAVLFGYLIAVNFTFPVEPLIIGAVCIVMTIGIYIVTAKYGVGGFLIGISTRNLPAVLLLIGLSIGNVISYNMHGLSDGLAGMPATLQSVFIPQ